MQGWINIIRSSMLKIRRLKAKEAAARKRAAVEGAAQESQQAQQAHREQQQALAALAASSATPVTHNNNDVLAYANSYSDGSNTPLPSVQPNQYASHSSTSPPQSSEDKYTVYRQWLDETKQNPHRKSTTTNRPAVSGDLHHTLLAEESKKSNFFERLCGACCPAWCFR